MISLMPGTVLLNAANHSVLDVSVGGVFLMGNCRVRLRILEITLLEISALP